MYIVMCRVSGGATGTRESPLKSNGAIKKFATIDEARAEAEKLTKTANSNPYRTADFYYWPEEAV